MVKAAPQLTPMESKRVPASYSRNPMMSVQSKQPAQQLYDLNHNLPRDECAPCTADTQGMSIPTLFRPST